MEVDMSLDDIIKEKKIGGFRPKAKKSPTGVRTKKPGSATGKFSSTKSVQKPMLDARNKIIQKNRAKIHDARDRLAQIAKRSGDARLKLIKKKKNVGGGLTTGPKRNVVANIKRSMGNLTRSTRSRPLELHTYNNTARPTVRPTARPVELHTYNNAARPIVRSTPRPVELHTYNNAAYQPTPDLRRTVKNDFAYGSGTSMPPLPTFKYMETPKRNENAWESDPFDCYEVPVARPYDVSEPRHLNRSIRTSAHMDTIPAKGILRTSSNSAPVSGFGRSVPLVDPYPVHTSVLSDPRRRYQSIEENSHLSSEMRSRLQRTPDINQSSGIFSYAGSSREVKQSSSGNAGYRIVVSNLHNSVSQSDIKELFEDIGELIDARLVRTGVAEVVFEKLKDAEAAVETYHNRQLDGQPMKCMLVNPRASNKPTAPAIKTPRSNATKSSKVEVDIDALYSVLFRRN